MKNIIRLSSIIVLLLSSASGLAGEWNTNGNGVVLDGYDVVSYRTDDTATKGLSRYLAVYDDVKFHFSSKKHKELFVKNPEFYIPKYNGFCAFAVGAKNALVPANSDTFKIYNGDLLVYFNDQWNGQKVNTKIPWNNAEEDLFEKAEINWKQLR